jgi:hypothetical protein
MGKWGKSGGPGCAGRLFTEDGFRRCEETLDVQRSEEQGLGAGFPGELILPGLIGGSAQPKDGWGGEHPWVNPGIGAGDQIIEQLAVEVREVKVDQEQAIGFLESAVEGSERGAGGADPAMEEGFEGFAGEAEEGGVRMGNQYEGRTSWNDALGCCGGGFIRSPGLVLDARCRKGDGGSGSGCRGGRMAAS